MADQKVSDLPSLNGADVDAADLLYIIDSSAGSAGSKKITVGQYQLAPVSAGTANGVMYLNASKVATAGSDLVFDGTNLGVGTSSPGAKLEVVGAVKATVTPSDSIQSSFLLSNSAATSAANFQLNTSGGLAFWSFQSGGAGWFNSATLDASGNLGLGVTPSAWVAGSRALQLGTTGYTALSQATGGDSNLTSNVYLSAVGTWTAVASLGASRYQLDFGAHKWFTAPSGTAGNAISFTQAMTLTSGGDLLVGTTSSTRYQNQRCLVATVPNNGDLAINHSTVNSSGDVYVGFGYNGAAIGSVTQSGTTAVLYNTTSDQRLKTNIVDAPDAAALIDSIQVRSFDWIADGSHQRYGMVAQELAEVAPEAVHAPADPDEMMAVDYSKLVPMLIKEIQSLRARVAALESA